MPIVVLGSANMDLVVRQERLPLPGETIFGSSFTTIPGGKGLNQAIAAARLGAEVEFIGSIGSDEYGLALLRALEADGVGTSHVVVTSDSPTGTAHISVTNNGGENSIVVVAGANATLTDLNESQREVIRSSEFLAMQGEIPLSVIREALEVAKAASTFTVLTPAPVQDFGDKILSLVDLIVPNELEALEITNAGAPEEAAKLLSVRGRSAVTTLGPAGCMIAEDGVIVGKLPGRRVRAVDTTAAGDTFVGALVTRMAMGDQLTAAAKWANVAASISATREGATSSMPRLDEVLQLLEA